MDENGADGNSNGYQAPGVERCLRIMELLAESHQGLTLSELVEIMDVPKNGVFRVAMTMLDAGYLNRDEDSKRFTLSKKMLVLGYSTVSNESIVELSRDVMHSLREVTRETVCLGARVESDGIILDQLSGLHPFKFSLDIGFHFPLYVGSPGRAILANLTEQERDKIFSGLEIKRWTDKTITDRRAILDELQRIRETGYALDLEEGFVNCNCIGSPIFDHNNYPIAAIWTTGPSERMPKSYLEEIAPVVIEHADRITRKLGK